MNSKNFDDHLSTLNRWGAPNEKIQENASNYFFFLLTLFRPLLKGCLCKLKQANLLKRFFN